MSKFERNSLITKSFAFSIFSSYVRGLINDRGGTFRAVYTVRFKDAVIVLHVFQKKSKSGIATAKKDIDLIQERLQRAEVVYKDWKRGQRYG